MVGTPALPPDSAGFLIRVVNEGTVEDTVSWLEFFDIPDSAFMRDFRFDANTGIGYPIPNGQPGTRPGDTVRFAPVTIAPDMSQMVELYFADFSVDELGNGLRTNVHGKEFVFRFSDGSVITVRP